MRGFRHAIIVGCAVAAAALFSEPASAQSQSYQPFAQESSDYWSGYWGWYDGYYRPYYQRRYMLRPDSLDGRQIYRGRIYDDTRFYRGYRPGMGVNVGPFSFEYWR
jgi:hypothetical protein